MVADGHFTYKQSGVDVAAGNEAVRLLKERLRSVRHPLVLEGIGGFAGLLRVPPVSDAVLVAGTDGAGTKVMLAREMGVYDTIGIDAVAMSVNDVSACGATPLFFLDYLVVGKVDPQTVADIVGGVDEGCLRAGCALLGGETAEHPGHFRDDDAFDLAGFAVGIASRSALWGPANVAPGDALLGIASNGLHSNGFSLVRALLAERHIALTDPSRRPRRGRPPGATPTLAAPRSARCCSPRPPSTAPCLPSSAAPAPCTPRRTSPAAASPTTWAVSCPTAPPRCSTCPPGSRSRSSPGCTASA